MVHKTIIYNSSHYSNGEEVYIFKMQKRIKILGLILDYDVSKIDSVLKIRLGEELYMICLEKDKGYTPLEILHNYTSEENIIFSIIKEGCLESDKIVLKIILELE